MTHLIPDPLPDDEILPVWLGDDPDMAYVHADMAAWQDARPECKCPALCVCDDTDRPSVYHPA